MATFRKPAPVFKYAGWGILTGIGIGFVGALFQLLIHMMVMGRIDVFGLLANHLVIKLIVCLSLSILFITLAIYGMRRFAPDAAGSGVPQVEGILEGKLNLHWRRILPVKFFTGIFALSSGLVLGREGPTIQMGAAIGDMLGNKFKLDKELTLCLIAAGAGAGLGTAFNAPLAGILFVVEEMRSQFRYSFKSVQAVIIACVFADIVLRAMFQMTGFDLRAIADIMMTSYSAPPLASLWLFVICGICFGIMGVIFNRMLVYTLNIFARMSRLRFRSVIVIIGILTGTLSIYFPYAINGGYEVIPMALHNHFPLFMLFALVIIRLFTTWISYGTGIPGGIFAPLIALGTLFGMLFGLGCHYLMPELIPNPQVFAVAGMAALFNATVGAPLTGIVLVVEMTMNFELILPLILTCFSATLSSIGLGGMPVYSVLLKRIMVLMKKKALYLDWSIHERRKLFNLVAWKK